jgi:hypothetical protein
LEIGFCLYRIIDIRSTILYRVPYHCKNHGLTLIKRIICFNIVLKEGLFMQNHCNMLNTFFKVFHSVINF